MKTLILLLSLTSVNLFAQVTEPTYKCEGKNFKKADVVVTTAEKALKFTEGDHEDNILITSRKIMFNVMMIKGHVVDKETRRVMKKVALSINLNYMRGSLTVISSTPVGFSETTFPLSCRVE